TRPGSTATSPRSVAWPGGRPAPTPTMRPAATSIQPPSIGGPSTGSSHLARMNFVRLSVHGSPRTDCPPPPLRQAIASNEPGDRPGLRQAGSGPVSSQAVLSSVLCPLPSVLCPLPLDRRASRLVVAQVVGLARAPVRPRDREFEHARQFAFAEHR